MMNDRPPLPIVTNQALAERLEGVKAVLAERIDGQASQLNDRFDRVRVELNENTEAMHVLEKQEGDRALRDRERNGQIATLTRRLNDHDDWHGTEDSKIRDRIGILEGEEHDAQVKASVWKGQLKAAMGGAGLCGSVLGICRALGLL